MSMSRRKFVVGSVVLLSGVHMAPRVQWVDRLRRPGVSELGTRWRLGSNRNGFDASDVRLSVERVESELCYRLHGRVGSTRRVGPPQMTLDLSRPGYVLDATGFRSLRVRVRGNGEAYAIHLRTGENVAPWDHYVASFVAPSEWVDIDLPFASFERARRVGQVDASRLLRLAVVAADGDDHPDLCVSAIGLVEA